MKGFDFLHIKPASSKLEPHDLSFDHLTTMDFGQIVPLACIESVPRDSFRLHGTFFSRLTPLVKPTYGRFYFKTASFFVPEFMLADESESFHAGNNTFEGVTANLRYFTYLDYFLFIYYNSASSPQDYDFSFTDSAGNYVHRKFTHQARYFIKVLNALGYALPENVDQRTTSEWYSRFASKKLNAMPLLAFCKAYNDYMSRSTRYNTSGLTSLLRCIKHNVTYGNYYSSSTCCISYQGLSYLLGEIKLCYENDYFVSAWQTPNSPLNSVSYPNTLDVPGNNSDSIVASTDDTHLDVPSVATASLNQRSLDFLRRFDDWARRYNYAGSRTYQKILAQFGIKTSDFRSNYAELIQTTSDLVRVGDVTATASSETSKGYTYVGDYAGKGIMVKESGFGYKSKDYGYLIVMGYFTVAPMYAYGFDRSVLRTNRFDFYTPQFDGVGAEAISYGELYTTQDTVSGDTYLDDTVYGFTERYNSYRFGRDKITGDFRASMNNSTMNSWHNGRILANVRASGDMVAQSNSMV